MTTFLGEILSARDSASAGEFRDMLSSVENKLGSFKIELVQALHSCFVATDLDVDRVSSRLDELKTLDNDLSQLTEIISHEKIALAMSEEEISCVNAELDECERSIALLQSLIQILQNLDRCEAEVDFLMASKRLKECETGLLKVKENFSHVEDHGWIRGLKTSINQKLKENYDRVLKEWNAKLRFGKSALTVDPYSTSFKSLIETFKNLHHYTRIWEKFCNQVWLELLCKACDPCYAVLIQEPKANSQRTSRKSISKPKVGVDGDEHFDHGDNLKATLQTIIKVRQLPTPYSAVEDVFNNVLILITVFHQIFDDNPIMQDFAELLGTKLISQLYKSCLQPLILEQSGGDREKALHGVKQLQGLRESLSQLSFELSVESEVLLDEFESNFDGLFMNQLREDVLSNIRQLIKSDVHQTVVISPKDISTHENLSPDKAAELHRNPFLQQQYKISKSVQEIIDVLVNHYTNYPDDAVLIENAFNLFISIVSIPKFESEAADFIPLTSILIHNNCAFLSHHADVTFPFCEDKISLLNTKGSQAFAFMVRSVRTKVNGMIAAAMTGLEKATVANGQSTGKFLAISAELDRLYTIFKDALPRRVCRQTLATLIDHTANEMCSKVLSWDDITASCADEVAESFTKFAVAITSTFKKEAPENTPTREIEVMISKVVLKWEKFRLLTFVLTASMKDIQDKWVDGCGPLSVFTPDEMRKLVRALFQNTDRRAAFLASIK